MLYIMRHGQTDWNIRRKLQGRTDIPLNENGKKMAEEVREECRSIGFDICYSSPLVRALETANIALAGMNVPVITDDRLKEMCFGEYEGCENAGSIEGSPMQLLFDHPERYRGVANGESFEDLFSRTGEFIEQVVKPELEKGKKILIVGHGAMNCSIICQLKNIPIEKFWDIGIPNCKLIKLS